MKVSRGRGRPCGRYHKLADFKALKYLTLISMNYGIDSNDFFNSFVEAWGRQESTCESLSLKKPTHSKNLLPQGRQGEKYPIGLKLSTHVSEI
jgi:hypothetical protein